MTESKGYDGWAILELLGHVRLAGRVTEESHFGVALGRIDIPAGLDTFTTQYFGGSSIYRLTPTSEQVARIVAEQNQPAPVHRWELPLAAIPHPSPSDLPYAIDEDERGYQQADDDEDERDLDEDDE